MPFYHLFMLLTLLSADTTEAKLSAVQKQEMKDIAQKQAVLISVHRHTWDIKHCRTEEELNAADTEFVSECLPGSSCCPEVDQREAEKCETFSEFLTWYNEKFNAQAYVDEYVPEKSDNKFDEVAENIDQVLSKLKIINKVFEEAKPNYEDVFEKLKNADHLFWDIDSTPIEDVEEEFVTEASKRLIQILGQEYVNVRRYMGALVGATSTQATGNPTVEYIHKVAEILSDEDYAIDIENHYADIYTLLKAELRIIEATLTSQGIEVELTFTLRPYDIVEQTSGDSDYTVEFNAT